MKVKNLKLTENIVTYGKYDSSEKLDVGSKTHFQWKMYLLIFSTGELVIGRHNILESNF